LALNLAYQGARAEKQDFAITLQRSFDPGQADVFPQDIARVLLNLISSSLRKNLEIGALAVFLPRVLGRSGCCEQTLT
jgi:hypothetical protein